MTRSPDGLQQRTEKARNFAQNWVSSNVYSLPGAVDVSREIDRLASLMTADARLLGIRGGDIACAVGNIDDFLGAEYAKAAPLAL